MSYASDHIDRLMLLAQRSQDDIAALWNFTDRGDPAAWDFSASDFTCDASWYDLPLASIVPAGAKAVLLRVAIQDDATGSYFAIRPAGRSNAINCSVVRTQAAGVYNDRDVTCVLDEFRTVQYSASAVAFSDISVLVMGWWS